MNKTHVLLCLFVILLTGLNAVPRELVVVEIGTGTWCQYCPGAAMGAHDLLANNHPVAIVRNHNGDSFANTYSNARNLYYGVTGYPTAFFDGLNAQVGGSATQSMYSTYLTKVNSRLAVASAYTITASGSGTGTNYQIAVNVSKPEADANTNVVLHACLTQSNIAFNWFNQTELDNVNRLMMPNQNGTPIALATGGSSVVNLNLTTQAAWPVQDLELVLWLQNTSTKEILQGKKYSLASLMNPSEVTVGSGDQLARKPVDMYWRNSLFQCLYFQDELNIASGSITGLKFYNNFVSDLPNMPTKIWLGSTTLTSLNAYIPSTQLIQVFDGYVYYPTGQNTISINFNTPYQYNGGTLVMMVYRPEDIQYYHSSDNFYCQTVGTNRALDNHSDSVFYDPMAPPTNPAISGQFPKTTFVLSGSGTTSDLSALVLTGNSTPMVGTAANYTVTVLNSGTVAQSNYLVKLYDSNNVELASTNGLAVNPNAQISVLISWTPTQQGPMSIYGKVVLPGDSNPSNDQTPPMQIVVQPAGSVFVTVGTGNQTTRMPLDFFYKNSLYQTLYYPDEIGMYGTISSLSVYNQFTTTTLLNMPTKIWMGTTTQPDLSLGWIPSTEMTLVYDASLAYPAGANTITYPLMAPFSYSSGNLVVMFNRPMDTTYYSSQDYFYCQTEGTNRARNVYSDTILLDPAAPPNGILTGIFPMTTFMFGQTGDPFGSPVVLPTSMSIVANVTIGGQQAVSGDVVAAFVNVGGLPQLRGKQVVQVSNGIAGCILQVYTETNGEVVSFKVWKSSTNEVLDCPVTLNTIVNGTVGEWPNNLFVINASSAISQSINLQTGWNLISLNVSPVDHSLTTLLAPILAQVQQVKGTEGVYIPGNPYSSLTSLIDGKAYSVLVSAPVSWIVSGMQIPVSTPLSLADGWNMAAYLPQNSLPVTTAMQSVANWLEQVKGSDGVYIPGNPYSTLTTMSPGKGYWIKLNGAHTLVYPAGRGETATVPDANRMESPVQKSNSQTVLAGLGDYAHAGDLLMAFVGDELRGISVVKCIEGRLGALLQVFSDLAGEQVEFRLKSMSARALMSLYPGLLSEPGGILGDYAMGDFYILSCGEPDVPQLVTGLGRAWPNPFKQGTNITVNLSKDASFTRVEIFNLKGQMIRTLASDNLVTGSINLWWDGQDDSGRQVPSGVYFCRLQSGKTRDSIKLILMK